MNKCFKVLVRTESRYGNSVRIEHFNNIDELKKYIYATFDKHRYDLESLIDELEWRKSSNFKKAKIECDGEQCNWKEVIDKLIYRVIDNDICLKAWDGDEKMRDDYYYYYIQTCDDEDDKNYFAYVDGDNYVNMAKYLHTCQ